MKLHWSNLTVGLFFLLGTLLTPLWLQDSAESIPGRTEQRASMTVPGLGRLHVGPDAAIKVAASSLAAIMTAPLAVIAGDRRPAAAEGQKERGRRSYLDLLADAAVEPWGGHTIAACNGELPIAAQLLAMVGGPELTMTLVTSSPLLYRTSWPGVVLSTLLVDTSTEHEERPASFSMRLRCLAGAGSLCLTTTEPSEGIAAEKDRLATASLRDVLDRRGLVGPVPLVLADYGPLDHEALVLAATAVLSELSLAEVGQDAHIVTRAAVHFYFGTMSPAAERRAGAFLGEAVTRGLRVLAVHGACPWEGDLLASTIADWASTGGVGMRAACDPRLHLAPCAVLLLRKGQDIPADRDVGAARRGRRDASVVTPPHDAGIGWGMQLAVLAVAVGTGLVLVLGISRNWRDRRRRGAK
jgi:hypothetical protein